MLTPLPASRRLISLLRRPAGALLLLLLLTAAAPPQSAAPMAPLALRAAPLALAPPRFAVAAVVDARPERGAVAALLPPTPGPAQAVDLAGGAAAAVLRWARGSVPTGAALRPITLHLTECRITEQAVPGQAGQVAGQVRVSFRFEGQRAGQPVALTEYHGAARYVRPARALTMVEPALRDALGRGLRYLNDWLGQAEGHDPRLLRGLRLRFEDYAGPAQPDTLFYAPGHLLTRADFLGPRRAGPYAAAVFPSFSFSARPLIRQDSVLLTVQTKVFVVRSSSWMTDLAPEAAVLSHEQRHFDLVRLVARRFQRRVQAARPDVADFNAVLQLAYFTAYQEMSRLQEQYDAETSHGTNEAAQRRWDQQIDAELRAVGR